VTTSKSALVTWAAVFALGGCAFESGATLTGHPSGRFSSVGEPEAEPLSSLRGNTRNAIAWAPLAEPEDVAVEGSVPSSRAWSTSKVLVIAAYLDTVAQGDPGNIPTDTRASIRAALARSDEPAIKAIRGEISDPVAAMTRILRSIGDTTTMPRAYEGTTQWSVREQVRFMAALGNGRVVSSRASAFLLREMQPIESQRWGLGTIGAHAFKPGWMNAQTESRQMGIVGDFAVAIITAGEASARQGVASDSAHATQLNRLARLLAERLDEARCLRSDVVGWSARWCFGALG
jgi:hypothetical protein